MTSFIQQDLIPPHLDIAPRSVCLRKLGARDVGAIIKHILDNDTCVLGLSLRVCAKDGKVDTVAFATRTHIFQVSLGQTNPGNCNDDLARLLASASCQLAAFDMARLALHLYKQCRVRVHGVDLSTLFAVSTAAPDTPAELVSKRIHLNANRHRIHAMWYNDEIENVCLRAWLSALIAEASTDPLRAALKVDTNNVPNPHLQCLAELVTNVALLEAEKPTQADNEFEDVVLDEYGQLVIQNARYNTRVRRSKQTTVILETTNGDRITGHAVHAEGKRTDVVVPGGNFRGEIERIRTVGREEPTHAERARDEFILLLLRGEVPSPSLARSSFVRALWFPLSASAYGRGTRGIEGSNDGDEYGWSASFAALNASQKDVVRAMCSDEEPLVVVHGPPGTGKTRTISVALEEWDRCREPAWVIAQSNVGVKNIARTLIKHGVDFKLLVSKEFYVEWHEHLYEEIKKHLIRADELIFDRVVAERFIGESTVILCTVSMLSNPGLGSCGIYDLVPVERLVVDEASQIDSFEFMHLFHKFHMLHKVCMFGDPKQLPPFGKETAPLMKTIFDFKHLKPSAYFLNTQYRMPVPLGEFISEEVYNSKLKSIHNITDSSCVRFVDVRKGVEESMAPGWKNTEEVHAVVNIVKNYYKHLEFCIITPYDAQRNAIVQRLKHENLPWESVYNVDSFQGTSAYLVSPQQRKY
ncbi:P-loop containing nucleoside triphosphate hydrolase protein [Ganoderma leucocontextum]|nr:P-loop containing nucleoside triphosphate hydrolase protein [Ganoderma leucocontextum]